MKTPISDFVTKYAASDTVRFHMPGHKGKSFLGCEAMDITELSGADALYEAAGIIAESEQCATELFGTARTVFSTEGSSQCVRGMLYLAKLYWQNKVGTSVKPLVVAARNVHKSFIYAAVLLDFDIVWLWPEEEDTSLCSCMVRAATLERVLQGQDRPVAAVYITSPNYLGKEADVAELAEVCHRNGTILVVDNAHGAYLKFLNPSRHPMDLGADICCDSAHKTLPVLTGGAYLHISKTAPQGLASQAKQAMELFGSTSPSYLIMQSLDLCNAYLTDGYRERLKKTISLIEDTKRKLAGNGWQTETTDPLKITIKAPMDVSGQELAELLRKHQIECEYADADFLVLMATPENEEKDFEVLLQALGKNEKVYGSVTAPVAKNVQKELSVREAFFSEGETIPVEKAQGRICRMPTATCPPAIPVVVPGEQISEEAIRCFKYYGMKTVDVVKKA